MKVGSKNDIWLVSLLIIVTPPIWFVGSVFFNTVNALDGIIGGMALFMSPPALVVYIILAATSKNLGESKKPMLHVASLALIFWSAYLLCALFSAESV